MKKRSTVYLFVLALLAAFSCQKESSNSTNKIEEEKEEKVDNNPVIKDMFTADPAGLVYNDTFFLYTGHDEQVEGGEGFLMNDWYVFSSTDMVNWTNHGARLATTDFDWSSGQAWAAHVVEKDGKFYWYVTVEHATIPGKSIGVAVADSPLGPFTDALGKALITNDMTKQTNIFWDDIDPAVFIDDDGQAYLYWGNTVLKWAKLKDNMTELDGEIHTIDLPEFTEGPWVHKQGDTYYMTYAAAFPERIDYATAPSPEGPWTARGKLNDILPNSPTNHPAVVEYKNKWYFVYHSGNLPGGGEFRRSVCIDYLYHNEDGTLRKIQQTTTGVEKVN